MNNIKASPIHLIAIRWVTLLNVILLYELKIKSGSALLLALAVIYCLLLTLFWRKVTDIAKRYTPLLLIDMTISGLLVVLTGGSWASPYFAYALTSILIASSILSMARAIVATGYFGIIYVVGTLLNKDTMLLIARFNDYDLLAESFIALLILTIFFGYPAHVIRKIRETQELTSQARESLHETKEIMAAITAPDALSCRELEVLECLSKGKTNREIADELYISEKTVKSHLYRIYKKLDISSREEAIMYFYRKYSPNGSEIK